MSLYWLYRRRSFFGFDGASMRQDPARKAEEQHSPEICITCSNIKRSLVWPDNVVVRRKIRASRRLSHRFELLLFSFVSFSLSLSLFSPPRSLYPFRSDAFFFLFSSISAAFLTQSSSRSLSTCLGSSLRVKAVVRRNIKDLRRRRSKINSWTGELLNFHVIFSCIFSRV